MKALLQIRGLKKSFGGVKAVEAIDLDINEGEIVGVIGPNGSGKTTTFNMVTGLIRADSGSILWDGAQAELVERRPWQIFELGVARTFQNIRLSLGLSILENVMVGLYLHQKTSWAEVMLGSSRVKRKEEESRERAFEALRTVSDALARSPDRLAAELSYADRRRVEIARAIVSRPKLLLLDEPTAGMNSKETDEIADDIRKLNQTVTIALVEHKMKFIAELAHRVAVLNFGRKIAEGPYESIRSNEAVIEAYLGRRRAA